MLSRCPSAKLTTEGESVLQQVLHELDGVWEVGKIDTLTADLKEHLPV